MHLTRFHPVGDAVPTPCLDCAKATHCEGCDQCDETTSLRFVTHRDGSLSRVFWCDDCAGIVARGEDGKYRSSTAVDYDPTLYCIPCNALLACDCDCGGRAEND
jgi:hypothetical protein